MSTAIPSCGGCSCGGAQAVTVGVVTGGAPASTGHGKCWQENYDRLWLIGWFPTEPEIELNMSVQTAIISLSRHVTCCTSKRDFLQVHTPKVWPTGLLTHDVSRQPSHARAGQLTLILGGVVMVMRNGQMNVRLCARCNGPIRGARAHKSSVRYCSEICAAEASTEQQAQMSPTRHMSPGKAGALKELLVSADLLMRGYDVFRALSPSAPCDMIIHKGGELLRIEVATGYRRTDGSITWTKHDPANYDIMACMIGLEIFYVPEFP